MIRYLATMVEHLQLVVRKAQELIVVQKAAKLLHFSEEFLAELVHKVVNLVNLVLIQMGL